ncbi:unnamed protein product [Echinostoma caproni]|uniref:Gamma carbonic anhydrase family protein n=1 Tax=Echinostoma caproni TaxID=27848 RepID=A0A183AGF0_9TREM|nr:unnamed protein product [Echinostoma caproni]
MHHYISPAPETTRVGLCLDPKVGKIAEADGGGIDAMVVGTGIQIRFGHAVVRAGAVLVDGASVEEDSAVQLTDLLQLDTFVSESPGSAVQMFG